MYPERGDYFLTLRLKDAISTVGTDKFPSPPLPLQERKRVREETEKIKVSLNHFSLADRIGSSVSLYCATKLYLLKLKAIEDCFSTYRRALKDSMPSLPSL